MNNEAKYALLRSACSNTDVDAISNFYSQFHNNDFCKYLTLNRAKRLCRLLVNSSGFSRLSTSDFFQCKFFEVVAQHPTFLKLVAIDILKHSNDSLLDATHKYVVERGGLFINITIEKLDQLNNLSMFEKELLASPNNKNLYAQNVFPEIIANIYESYLDNDPNYVASVFKSIPPVFQGTRILPSDFSSKYVNVVDGARVTTDIPSGYKNKLLLVGWSTLFGRGSEDCETIASFLQRSLVMKSRDYLVQNHGFPGNPLVNAYNNLTFTELSEGDVVVLFGYEFDHADNEFTYHCDLSDVGEREGVFTDSTHFSPKGNELIAGKISAILESVLAEGGGYSECTDSSGHISPQKYVDFMKYLVYKRSALGVESAELLSYVKKLKEFDVSADETIGSLVVNCNPMTLGHYQLIEYGSSKVDKLYVFIVEEDLSFFSFEDRFQIVKQALASFQNIEVVPGGRFICTELTFPEYFSREASADVADASMEAWFFAEYIAPVLGITKIFSAEEPNCRVSSDYNDKMIEILPNYGIEIDLIPRFSCDQGEIISASLVRRYLKQGEFDKIKRIVPKATYDFLLSNYSNANCSCEGF